MAKLVAVALALVLVVYSLIDCLQTPRREVRGESKAAWVAAILLLPVAGAVAWLVAGRAREETVSRAPRPVAPDDDPDFLRRVASIDDEYEAVLRRWERDQRRRRDEATPPRGPGVANLPGSPGPTTPGPAAQPPTADGTGSGGCDERAAPHEEEPRHEQPGS